jgi:hypothetical protein
MTEDREDKGFKVKDKRKIFTEAAAEETKTQVDSSPSSGPDTSSPGSSESESQSFTPLPEINFSTFILSLSTSALMHLGELPNPETHQVDKNLPLAKQTIDLIDMLKQKTEGNLEEDETQLITNLLYDLKLKYVAAIKKT